MSNSEPWSGRHVMITGGLGMIGSTIALQLVPLGAKVTIVDANIRPYGANLVNLDSIRNQVQVTVADIRDKVAMKGLVRGQDVIFNLAGQVSHNDSMADPFLDADINYIGHLNVLESLRLYNREAVIVHAGSRLQFGRIETIPVREDHPLRPRTPYALNKTAAENMYAYYYAIHGIRTVMFRIANPYGPRSQIKHSKYSMLNWFIRLAMEDKALTVYGDGSQVRDYVYVDDLASAFVVAASSKVCAGEVFNVGSGVGVSFREMAEVVVREVGLGQVVYIPWPDDYINVETGDYVTDISKISRYAGWVPKVGLSEGIRLTVDYYRKHWESYC